MHICPDIHICTDIHRNIYICIYIYIYILLIIMCMTLHDSPRTVRSGPSPVLEAGGGGRKPRAPTTCPKSRDAQTPKTAANALQRPYKALSPLRALSRLYKSPSKSQLRGLEYTPRSLVKTLYTRCRSLTQRAQYPLIKDYSLDHI